MWSSDRSKRHALTVVAAIGLAGLSACTARPLYGDAASGASVGAPTAGLAALRGRIAVREAQTRTTQIVRNDLLLRLNQATPVENPLYRVDLTTAGVERGITIESSGVPRSAIYTLTVTYSIVRLADNEVIDEGRRQVITPFDRTRQLFQSQRALLDAREQAGGEAAAQLELAIARALEDAGA